MTTENKSILALNKFKNSLKHKKKYGNQGFKFIGLVIYDVLEAEVSEVLECIIITGGFNPEFRINTDDKGTLITSDDYHLVFNPSFPKNTIFAFDENKQTFIIEGKNSPKFDNYKVSIFEKV